MVNRRLAMSLCAFWTVACMVVVNSIARADEPAAAADASRPLSVEEVVAKVKPSVVVVTIADRSGQELGLGTGFVVSKDGLIATNLHVIGEARPIAVQFADGKKFDVTEIHATEKSMDLAVLRINATDLTPLVLGDSDTLNQGQTVVAVGNPLGLRHSVVSGIVSEKRDVEGRPMIQIAMPIEKGNSGGPLVDLHGRVHGLITLKSLLKENLGFAIVVNALKPLLEKPNPVPIAQWTTIGVLDEKQWKPLFGARWQQRAGRIVVDEPGRGFGGRSICLATEQAPDQPFELGVTVKFTPEDGAAGLVFHADGEHKHYGFYPSNGKLRLSRFDGPDVYSWKVLDEVSHPAYRPNDWNTIKIQVERASIKCFINGQLAIESQDDGLSAGAVGLAKFRDTRAEFKQFQVGKQLPTTDLPAETLARIQELAREVTSDMGGSRELVGKLADDNDASLEALRREAKLLEQRAERLKELAIAVHAHRTQRELADVLAQDAQEFDLLRAALLIAKLDNEELDVDAYVREVDRMAADIRARVGADASEADRLQALHDYLFKQRGFHGSRTNYYHRSNSYLNEVIDDREGLPITLSVLHIELARRLGLKVVGVGLPGHFVVRFEPQQGEPQILDVFDQGRHIRMDEVQRLVRENLRRDVDEGDLPKIIEESLATMTSRSILTRMLSNLRNVAEQDRDTGAIQRYLDTMLTIDSENLEARARRIDLEIRSKRLQEAITDIDWMIEKRPAGMNLEAVIRLRSQLEAELKQRM